MVYIRRLLYKLSHRFIAILMDLVYCIRYTSPLASLQK